MKLRLNIVITFITAAILASCSSAIINYSNELAPPSKIAVGLEVKKYFRYQDFGTPSFEEIDNYILRSSHNKKELQEIKALRSNLKKIASTKKFTLTLEKSNLYSFELMELIYSLDLPITIQWKSSAQENLSSNIITKKIIGFCSSIYENAQESIVSEIINFDRSSLIVYMEEYSSIKDSLTKQYPEIRSAMFEKESAQNFASKLLGINGSASRFKKITSLNPNQKLNFIPRSRDDVKNIIFLLRPDRYKSLLPAFRYHGGEQFQYLNFISSLEMMENTKQLLDYENSFIPFPFALSNKIQNKEIVSLERIIERSVLNDWLLIEIIKQSGIRSANVAGMTGSLEFQRGKCTKRIIPMQRVSARWITS